MCYKSVFLSAAWTTFSFDFRPCLTFSDQSVKYMHTYRSINFKANVECCVNENNCLSEKIIFQSLQKGKQISDK